MLLPHSIRMPHARKQQGAALMLMLVILVLGAATVLVTSLNSSGLRMERDKITADALAQAKEALIGYAVKDDTRPGELPCPDLNNDGMITPTSDYNGSNCKTLIGRLPWKTLDLPDLRDGQGEHLWYAISNTFHASGSAMLNSDIPGELTITGNNPASNIIAIIFAPGHVLNEQSRSASIQVACTTRNNEVLPESLCATNYLEGTNGAPSSVITGFSPNLNYQSANATSTFNDQVMPIMPNDLFSKVERRIAKELLLLLQAYKAAGVYPYPAKFTDCKAGDCDSDKKECSGWIPVGAEPNGWVLPPWFINNAWYRVIYYSVGTGSLGSYNGAGGGGGGWGGTSCESTVDISGSSVTGLFFMPGPKLGGVIRPGINADPSNTDLPNYLEDVENIDGNDHVFVRPGTTTSSNDLLFVLP